MNFVCGFHFSEDVRHSLNVLDQVLSEFDDNDSDTESFLEDKFIVSPAENNEPPQRTSKFDIEVNKKNQMNNDKRKVLESKEESRISASNRLTQLSLEFLEKIYCHRNDE